MANCKFEVFKDRAGEWRWRLRDTNGKIIADSGEGYITEAGAKAGIANVKSCASTAIIA